MTKVLQRLRVGTSAFGLLALLAGGCGGDSGSDGLAVDVTFAPGVPRASRDEAIRVEVYLVDSCDSVAMGDRPSDALDSMFVLRDGSSGPAIGIPEPGEYGLYAVAQDADCAVVGAGCDDVSIDSAPQAAYPVELGAFAGQGCFANQQCSTETGECLGGNGECVDLDSDGLGDGTLGNVGCVDTTTDSNDDDELVCADTDGDSCDDCSSGSFDPLDDGMDADGDGICDAGDVCVDADGDGLGDGTGGNVGCVDTTTDSNLAVPTVCADTDGDGCDDCSSGSFDPLDDGVDSDADGICDSGDDCVDADGDGLGDGTMGNVGCVDTTTDSNDGDGSVCADTDGDSCDDCAVATFDPSNDGLDGDGDGFCALGDCDDDKPLCAAVCTDVDADGYCIDTDCDDAVPTCSLDCTTNSDGGPHVDCFETFCGTDPADSGSECLEVSSELDYETAINAANDNPGDDFIVLNDFTMTTGAPSINDSTGGLTIRQVAGATLTVDSGGNRLVFEMKTQNNVIDGVHVLNVLNAEDIVLITADNNTVQNCRFEGFERRGIYIDGGNSAQILDNIITGGTNAESNEVGAIIVRDTIDSVVAGNTVVLNAMDGLQIRKATRPIIDHNTIADNGGSGLEFYGDDSFDVCLRNNNVTGNAEFGYHGAKVVTFDTSAACTAPLSSGPAYGNNDFNNGGSCGGDDCLGCGCLPPGSFWGYSVDPLYTSTTADDPDLYCLGAPTLIDGGDDLLAYDLNGEAAGDFNGSSPDIGSREDGPGDCN
ncbi:MAG: right-handed parallel beta-helix repeat-containing protein [Myxococcales bacterium]|nr:right-handed parallel beta-helix repeat-containing protein [Deltaproteobacteria bacterium]MBT8481427.1 right-handed parallel beta-helix repeat-containing protein [Deltaproteobacteria bacterium]NNL24290.1 right-handed parallel beta-helix repeat-containing protein [Myxococcales bacterium]